MSRRKQPRASNALAEALAEQWLDRLSKDRAEMANVPRQYGATQTVPPPPACRSIASAPRDGRQVIVKYKRFMLFANYEDRGWWTDEGFGHLSDSELQAWTPIPEWTGEVAE